MREATSFVLFNSGFNNTKVGQMNGFTHGLCTAKLSLSPGIEKKQHLDIGLAVNTSLVSLVVSMSWMT